MVQHIVDWMFHTRMHEHGLRLFANSVSVYVRYDTVQIPLLSVLLAKANLRKLYNITYTIS